MTEPQRDPDEGRAEQLERVTFSLRSAREAGVHTISLAGELDLATAGEVQRELERVEATDARRIVLDLSELTFMDSTGVRLVVSANARSRDGDGRLELVRGPHNVQRVFELCGVVELLPFV